MQRQERMDHLALMVDDITLALRPSGIDPTDVTACAETLRDIADALSAGAPTGTTRPAEPQLHR